MQCAVSMARPYTTTGMNEIAASAQEPGISLILNSGKRSTNNPLENNLWSVLNTVAPGKLVIPDYFF